MNLTRFAGFTGALILVLVCALLLSPCRAESKDNPKDCMFEKEFSFEPGGTLIIDVEDVDFEIRTGAAGTSSVQVYVSGKDREKAREYFEKINFEAHLDDNRLILKNRQKRHINIVGFWNAFRNTHAWALVIVPERIDVEIRTEDGDITLESIAGSAVIRTEDGDIDLSKIDGATIKIDTEDGDLEAKMLKSGTVTVHSEDGDVTIDKLQADDIVIGTEDGDLVLDQVAGECIELRTEDGDMRVGRAGTDKISIRTEDGDIEATVSGRKFNGRCYDGDMTITLLKAMEVIIDSEDGDVIITVPADSDADLDLGGEHVQLKSKISIKGNVSQRQIKGTFNNGGPLIKIRVDDGSIVFREK